MMSAQGERSKKVYVWNRFIRIFHWALVVGFFTNYFFQSPFWLHRFIGIILLCLVVARIGVGFWGKAGYARFKTFLYPPASIIQDAKDVISGKPRRYIGHDPLGALMVFALLTCFLFLAGTGVTMYVRYLIASPTIEYVTPLHSKWPDSKAAAVNETKGDMVHGKNVIEVEAGRSQAHIVAVENRQTGFDWLVMAHSFFANLIMLLVVLHIAGVIMTSVVNREDVISSMITGWKKRE